MSEVTLTKESAEAVRETMAAKFLELTNSPEFSGRVEKTEGVKKMMEFHEKFLAADTPEKIKALMPAFDDMLKIKGLEEEIKKINSRFEKKKGRKSANSYELGIKKALRYLEKKGTLKNANNQPVKIKFLLPGEKAVDNPMSDTTSVVPVATGAAPYQLTEFRPGLTDITRRKPYIVELVDFTRTDAEFIVWVEKQDIYPGVAYDVAEGAAASALLASFRLVEMSTQLTEITLLSRVTKRMLADVNAIQQNIFTELMELGKLRFDYEVVFGSGSGNQLNGITNLAQKFSNNSGLAVTSPNVYDCIRAAALQIRTNGIYPSAGAEIIEIFEPDTVIMNPADVEKMDLTKDTLGRYVLDQLTYPEDSIYAGRRIAGLRVVENIGMTAGTILVMDAKKAHAVMKQAPEITIGYINTDFSDNIVTIKMDMRVGFYIKTIEQRAFVMDTIANIQAAIVAV